MKRTKRGVGIRVLALALLASMLMTALPAEATVQSRYAVIHTFDAGLTISSDFATCYGAVLVTDSSTTVELYLELQRTTMTGDDWTKCKSWSTTGTEDVSLYRIRAVSSGYFYRVLVTATVYDANGNLIETQSMCSEVVEY